MKTTRALLGLSLCLASAGISRAQTGILSVSQARFASGKGNLAFLAAGVAAPLLYGKSHRPEVAGRFDKVLSVALATQALKAAFKERRPDGSSRDSFPSGHSSAAFAVRWSTRRPDPRTPPSGTPGPRSSATRASLSSGTTSTTSSPEPLSACSSRA